MNLLKFILLISTAIGISAATQSPSEDRSQANSVVTMRFYDSGRRLTRDLTLQQKGENALFGRLRLSLNYLYYADVYSGPSGVRCSIIHSLRAYDPDMLEPFPPMTLNEPFTPIGVGHLINVSAVECLVMQETG